MRGHFYTLVIRPNTWKREMPFTYETPVAALNAKREALEKGWSESELKITLHRHLDLRFTGANLPQ